MTGANGDFINAYMARPLGAGPFPAVVMVHHMPGWDEWYREATRKMAHHGYIAISPDLYHRAGHGSVDDVTAKVRASGGMPDDQVVADLAGAMNHVRSLSYCNGKVGIFGTCSGDVYKRQVELGVVVDCGVPVEGVPVEGVPVCGVAVVGVLLAQSSLLFEAIFVA